MNKSQSGVEGKRGVPRIVPAVHGSREILPDPDFEAGLSGSLKEKYGREGLLDLYGRYRAGPGSTRLV